MAKYYYYYSWIIADHFRDNEEDSGLRHTTIVTFCPPKEFLTSLLDTWVEIRQFPSLEKLEEFAQTVGLGNEESYWKFQTYVPGSGAECLSGTRTYVSSGFTLEEAKEKLVKEIGCSKCFFDDPNDTKITPISGSEYDAFSTAKEVSHE